MYSFVRRLLPLTLSLLGLAGCDGDLAIGEDEQVGTAQQAITNGSVDSSHHGVGVLHSGGSSACTATLIGPRTLLTAAHCVASESAPHTLLSPVSYYPEGFSGRRVAVASVTIHPGFQGADHADLAVVRLAEPLSDAPAQLAATAPEPGEMVDLVGYGKTGETSGDFGTRRHAAGRVGLVDAQTMRFFGTSNDTGNLCNGDSGGPTFATRGGQVLLIGVHTSKGGTCGQEGNDMRVDAFYRWVVEAAQGDLPVADLGPAPQADPVSQTGGPSSATSDRAPSDSDGAGGCSVAAGSSLPDPGLLLGLLLVALVARRAGRR